MGKLSEGRGFEPRTRLIVGRLKILALRSGLPRSLLNFGARFDTWWGLNMAKLPNLY